MSFSHRIVRWTIHEASCVARFEFESKKVVIRGSGHFNNFLLWHLFDSMCTFSGGFPMPAKNIWMCFILLLGECFRRFPKSNPPRGCSLSRSTQTASKTCRLILKDRCWVWAWKCNHGIPWAPAYRCYKLLKPWLGWLMLVDVAWFDYGNRMSCWKISMKLAPSFQTKANMKPENLLRKMLVSFPGHFGPFHLAGGVNRGLISH